MAGTTWASVNFPPGSWSASPRAIASRPVGLPSTPTKTLPNRNGRITPAVTEEDSSARALAVVTVLLVISTSCSRRQPLRNGPESAGTIYVLRCNHSHDGSQMGRSTHLGRCPEGYLARRRAWGRHQALLRS